MRVALISVYSHRGCTLKDVAGGFGTVFEVGRSWRARALERAKSKLADLPPLALGYLAAQLEAAGHEVVVRELRRDGARRDPIGDEPVAIVLTSLVDASAEREVLEELRRAHVHAIAVGAYASARPHALADVAGAVVVGEPEALGAAIVGARGVVQAGDVDDLDALPFPDWSRFDVPRYRYAFLTQRGPTLPAASARGCAYGCGYCPWRVTARFRQRDPARVAAEVRAQRDRHGAIAIAFRDPLFNLDRERTLELARGLAPIGVRYSAEMRADRLDEELLRALQRSGLRSLEIGVESVDTAMLGREKRKPPSHAEIEAVVRCAQALGIRVICNYVLGLPGDGEETIRATVEWAKRLDSFAVQFTVATPYPGTSLEPLAKDRMLDVRPDDLTGFRPTFRGDVDPERLAALREWAYVSYHFRPQYALRFARHALPALLD